jgi:hypothetical protein
VSLHQQLLDELDAYDRQRGIRDRPETALRAVVELHAPVPHTLYGNLIRNVCEGCDAGAYAEESPDWPCRTVQAIARELGIEAGEGR